jgi:tRNA (pseudouridine54-N1)-methyltransferase
MPSFAVIGHLARTKGDFALNDLPGSAGRMDILCRCVNTSLFLSHEIRRDVKCYLILQGDPDPPKTIMFSGESVRHLSPDERSAGALIRKALEMPCGKQFRESTKGVFIRRGGLEDLLEEQSFALLDESGSDIRTEWNSRKLPENYLLSDHMNLAGEEYSCAAACTRISVGPLSLHADHTITVVHNELDRRKAGWK